MTNSPCEITEIQNVLYQSLPNGPLTPALLAEALAWYFPQKTLAELEEVCQTLLEGIHRGGADFEQVEKLSEEEMDEEIVRRLQHALDTLNPMECKQYLMQLYEILFRKSGREITPELAAYAAGMEQAQLMDEVVFLLHQEGTAAGVQLLEAVEEGCQAHETDQSVRAQRMSDFTYEEHMWIAAASLYAAGGQEDNPVTDPETIGHQVGFLGRFIQSLKDVCKRYVAPALVSIASMAGIVYLANHAADWMIAGEQALASLAFFGADSILPSVISIVAGMFGVAALYSVFAIGTVGGLMYLVSNVWDDLDARAEQVLEKARRYVYSASPEAEDYDEIPTAENCGEENDETGLYVSVRG